MRWGERMGPAADDPRLERLERRLESLERRLDRLEGRPPEVEEEQPIFRKSSEPRKRSQVELIPLIGRTIMVLGGAFVLRAITEAEIVNPSVGAWLGIAYALVWLAVAWRVGADRWVSATFHGISTAIIAYPLLWETTVQFRSLTPAASAAVSAFIAVAALTVCAHRNLHRLAWVFVVFTAATLLGLAVATRAVPTFLFGLLVLGLVTLWVGWRKGWRPLAWFVAVPADLAILLAATIVLMADAERLERLFRPGAVLALLIALVIVYIGSFIARTLATGHDVTFGEITQGVASVAIGLGGAVALTRFGELPGLPLGVVALLMGGSCYAASFFLIDRADARRTNFVFYSTLALIFTTIALEVLLAGSALALALSLAAIATAWIGGWRGRATLSLHGAVYLFAATLTAGLLTGALAAWGRPGELPTGWMTTTAWTAFAVTLLCSAIPVAVHGRTWGRLSHVPRLVFLLLALIALGGIVTTALGRFLPAGDAGALAALRTGVVAVAAVALARLGRWPRIVEAGWLVYPVLLAGAVKLLFEDFRVGRPATLVLTLTLYGAALILAPRLARKSAHVAGEA